MGDLYGFSHGDWAGVGTLGRNREVGVNTVQLAEEQPNTLEAISSREMDTPYAVDLSDSHVGSKYGLCPERGFVVEGGGLVLPNPVQRVINECYAEFWEVVHKIRGDDPFIAWHKGDMIEGQHHRTKETITANLTDQAINAVDVLKPHFSQAERSYWVKGTPAHGGEESENEEWVARECGGHPDSTGRRTWPMVNIIWNGLKVNIAHHISSSSVAASQATAPQAEMVELRNSAAQVGVRPPDIVTRGHRHRASMVGEASQNGTSWSVTTPGWQGKTGYAYKHKGGRVSVLNVGGILWEYNKFWGATPHLIHWFIREDDGEPTIMRRG